MYSSIEKRFQDDLRQVKKHKAGALNKSEYADCTVTAKEEFKCLI